MNPKNFLNGLSPLPYEEKLFCRATNKSGEHFLQPLPVSALVEGVHLDSANEGLELRVLTWLGDNFAWKPILSAEQLAYAKPTVVNMTISGRTGYNKAILYKDTHVLVDRELFGFTSSLSDGVWRRASRLNSGRSVASVSGPEIPHNPALVTKWKGGSLHKATAQIVKAKERSYATGSVGITVEGSTNVVLASGLVVRTSFTLDDRVPIN